MGDRSSALNVGYCIYCNDTIDKNLMNPEHIIPLTLGGCDEFTIQVCKTKNSEANRRVDNPMKNDFFVGFQRMIRDYRGHRNEEPVLKNPKASLNDRPISVHWSKEKISAYDPINKTHLESMEGVKIPNKIDPDIRSKFIAKVTLAAGYFLFGDIFVNHADHKSLRKYVFNGDIDDTKPNLIFFDQLLLPPQRDEIVLWDLHKDMAKQKGCSGVIWRYTADKISSSVVIGGMLIGGVRFSASVNDFMSDIETQDEIGTIIWIEGDKITYTPYLTAFDESVTTLESQEDNSSSLLNKMKCSFCGKKQGEGVGLFAGNLCSICDECVICNTKKLTETTIEGASVQVHCSFCYEESNNENQIVVGSACSICQNCLLQFVEDINYAEKE